MEKNQLSHTYYSQNLFLLLAFEDKTQVSTETKSQWNQAFYIQVDNIIIHWTYLSHHIHPYTTSKRILIQMTPIKKEEKKHF